MRLSLFVLFSMLGLARANIYPLGADAEDISAYRDESTGELKFRSDNNEGDYVTQIINMQNPAANFNDFTLF